MECNCPQTHRSPLCPVHGFTSKFQEVPDPKEDMRKKFIREHPHHPTIEISDGYTVEGYGTKGKSSKYKKVVRDTKKVKAGICPKCEMRLSSPYHIKFPCK